MGNENTPLPKDNFHNTCHPGFVAYRYTADRELTAQIRMEEGLLLWRRQFEPLLPSRHLLLPTRIIALQPEIGCCAQQDFQRPDIQTKMVQTSPIQLCYEGFIYSFDKEILARKAKGTYFREQELWRLLGYLGRGAMQWQRIYATQTLGALCPQNIVMDLTGQVKIVCRLSFYHCDYQLAPTEYSAPETRSSAVVTYALNPHRDPQAIEASTIYSIAAVILDAVTLELSSHSPLSPSWKEQHLLKTNLSTQLKQLLLRMLGSQQIRPTFRQLLTQVKNNRTRHL